MKISNANLLILYNVAKELDDLKDSLVFVGGTVISLYVTEPEIVDIRETFDVDTIVEVVGRMGYEAFAKKLRAKGFVEDLEAEHTCRYKKGPLLLDVMPVDGGIWGPTNIWYKEAFKNTEIFEIKGTKLKVLKLPYLIATKIVAFKGRGRGSCMHSHDIEDIVVLFEGRESIANDFSQTLSPDLSKYLITEFSELIKSKLFLDSVEAHISDRENLGAKKSLVISRMKSAVQNLESS